MMWVYIAQVFNAILGAMGAFFLKKGTRKSLINTFIPVGIFLYGVSAVFFVILLKFAEVSILYPMTSMAWVWSFFLARYYLGEKITIEKQMGLGLIILGVIFLAVA